MHKLLKRSIRYRYGFNMDKTGQGRN